MCIYIYKCYKTSVYFYCTMLMSTGNGNRIVEYIDFLNHLLEWLDRSLYQCYDWMNITFELVLPFFFVFSAWVCFLYEHNGYFLFFVGNGKEYSYFVYSGDTPMQFKLIHLVSLILSRNQSSRIWHWMALNLAFFKHQQLFSKYLMLSTKTNLNKCFE